MATRQKWPAATCWVSQLKWRFVGPVIIDALIKDGCLRSFDPLFLIGCLRIVGALSLRGCFTRRRAFLNRISKSLMARFKHRVSFPDDALVNVGFCLSMACTIVLGVCYILARCISVVSCRLMARLRCTGCLSPSDDAPSSWLAL